MDTDLTILMTQRMPRQIIWNRVKRWTRLILTCLR